MLFLLAQPLNLSRARILECLTSSIAAAAIADDGKISARFVERRAKSLLLGRFLALKLLEIDRKCGNVERMEINFALYSIISSSSSSSINRRQASRLLSGF